MRLTPYEWSMLQQKQIMLPPYTDDFDTIRELSVSGSATTTRQQRIPSPRRNHDIQGFRPNSIAKQVNRQAEEKDQEAGIKQASIQASKRKEALE